MAKTKEISASYAKSERDNSVPIQVPIPAPGIGTRISDLAKAIGTREEASEVIGSSTAQLQRYIREANMPPFDVAARLCIAGGRSLEWLATGGTPTRLEPAFQSGSQDLSEANLNIALEYTDDIIRATRATYVPRSLYAKLLRLMYEGVTRGLPLAEIHDLGQQLVRAVISGTGEQGNGSQSGLDGPSQGSR